MHTKIVVKMVSYNSAKHEWLQKLPSQRHWSLKLEILSDYTIVKRGICNHVLLKKLLAVEKS